MTTLAPESTSPPASAARDYVQLADDALNRGDAAAVCRHLGAAAELDPDNPGLRLALGNARLHQRDLAGALAEYEYVAGLAPRSAEARASMALALQLLGRTHEAETAATVALVLEPRQVIALKVMARIHLDAGRPDEARVCCERVLAMEADDADAMQLREQTQAPALQVRAALPGNPFASAGQTAPSMSRPPDPATPKALPSNQLQELARHVGDAWKEAPYYDEAELRMEREWAGLIWPFLQDCDFSSVVDLAAGHGRNSEKLKQLAGHLWLVDINFENLAFCRRRFAGDPRFTFLLTDGTQLAGIPDASVSLVYCFDAMVHFDSDVVRGYLAECRRVLQPGGHGFCHHSNFTGNPGGSLYDNGGWRNFMSRELFAHYCAKEGLTVVKSRVIDWGGRPGSDCLTLFRKDSARSVVFHPTRPHPAAHAPVQLNVATPSVRPPEPAANASPSAADFDDEVRFWDRELSLQGTYGTDMTNRLRHPERVFPGDVKPLIDDLRHRNGRPPRVLDAGSGPLSYLAHGHQAGWMELVAADPLADVYLELLRKHGHQPTSLLVKCFGEQLGEVFGPGAFDLIYMKNALDHCQCPATVFRELVHVLRPGGLLYVLGGVREATRNNWSGLHQNDLYLSEGGRLMCESRPPGGSRPLVQCISNGYPLETVKCSKPTDETGQWLSVIWRKHDETPPSPGH